MISIAGIGIIVLIIWTVWRCRFKLLHFKKLKRRRKLIAGRSNLSHGLQIETEVEKEKTNRHTTYAVIDERNMIMVECWWMTLSWCKMIFCYSVICDCCEILLSKWSWMYMIYMSLDEQPIPINQSRLIQNTRIEWICILCIYKVIKERSP